jgi:hypothetical protein
MESDDAVNSPSHYKQGSIETIDCIIAATGEFEAISYCQGNALKYLHRMWHKNNPYQDVEKAVWYCKKMLELLELTKGKNW